MFFYVIFFISTYNLTYNGSGDDDVRGQDSSFYHARICKTHMARERTTLRNIFDQVLFALDAKIPFLSAKINMFFEQNYTKECDGLK